MATTSPLLIPQLHFLSPQLTLNRRLSLSKLPLSSTTTRIRAVGKEPALAERLNDVEWTGNGVAGSNSNGAVDGYVNGSVLVKYGDGNGVAAETETKTEVEASMISEDGRKRRLEEIGKEDAWFKQTVKESVQVRTTLLARRFGRLYGEFYVNV